MTVLPRSITSVCDKSFGSLCCIATDYMAVTLDDMRIVHDVPCCDKRTESDGVEALVLNVGASRNKSM